MSIISKLVESGSVDTSKDLADYSGGGFISESGVYENKVKRAWVIESAKGAIGIHVEFEGEGMYDQDFYVTNADKQTFYTKNGKEYSMPSYVDMKKLNYLITGNFLTSLAQLNVAQQIVKTTAWVDDAENEGKKKKVDVEKEVEYLTDWAGKDIKIAVQMSEKEAQNKVDGKYIGTGKRAENDKGEPFLEVNIIGFYNMENKTANEVKSELEPVQMDKDIARITKTPIRLFKAKAGGKPNGSKPSTTAGGTTKKVSVF